MSDEIDHLSVPQDVAPPTDAFALVTLPSGQSRKVLLSHLASVLGGGLFRGEVADENAMLALTVANKGDWCIRTDLNSTRYDLVGSDPGLAENWRVSGASIESLFNIAGGVPQLNAQGQVDGAQLPVDFAEAANATANYYQLAEETADEVAASKLAVQQSEQNVQTAEQNVQTAEQNVQQLATMAPRSVSASEVLTSADRGGMITNTSNDDITLEIPSDADAGWPNELVMIAAFQQPGTTGSVEFIPGTGASVSGAETNRTRRDGSIILALRTAADTWTVTNDVALT